MTTFKNLPPPPRSREEILAGVGSQRVQIYCTVRKILDDLEVVARWEQLYYPPTELEEFLRIQASLLSLIQEIPYRISEMTVQILEEAFREQMANWASSAVDVETQTMILGLLDVTAASAATPSTRRIAYESIDSFPEGLMEARQRQLLKWMIDRHAPEPSLELSGQEFEDAIQVFPDQVINATMKEILGNIQFYFDGIHEMSRGDLEKLQARIDVFRASDAPDLTAEERVFTCEISADLKGKYSSAIMGAASNLVSEGIWNGAEVEPSLFPEKADEFLRNDQLVTALQEVLASIRGFLEEVPLVDLVATWEQGKRVDRYALSHLYGFLGILGKLMKESSRRALYSGDYHQVQIRENRLSNRINEINMLHNKTWEVLDENDLSLATYYPQMVDKAVELAAVLDVEILKKVVGNDDVHVLLRIVSMEGEKRKELDVRLGHEQGADYTTPQSTALRGKVSLRRQSVLRLLYDEDLQTFLELLLGSVLKRASFAVKQRRAETGEVDVNAILAEEASLGIEELNAAEILAAPSSVPAAALPAEDMVHFEDLSVLDLEILPEPGTSTQVMPPTENSPAMSSIAVQPTAAEASVLGSQVQPPAVDSSVMHPESFAPAVLEPLSFDSPATDLPITDSPAMGASAPGSPRSGPEVAQKIEALEILQGSLAQAMSASHPRRKAFDLVHKLLSSKGMIPPAMMQSLQPFLESLSDTLVPQMAKISAQGDMPITYQSELLQFCRDLSRRDLTPRDLQTNVLTHMDGLLSLLGDIEAIVLELMDAYSASSYTSDSGISEAGDGGFLSSVE